MSKAVSLLCLAFAFQAAAASASENLDGRTYVGSKGQVRFENGTAIADFPGFLGNYHWEGSYRILSDDRLSIDWDTNSCSYRISSDRTELRSSCTEQLMVSPYYQHAEYVYTLVSSQPW